MKTLLRNLFCSGVLIAAASTMNAVAEDTATPETVVVRLETALIENMKAGDAMTFEDRFETLRPMLDEIMAVGRMGRYVFGSDWAAFEASQRDRFEEAFIDLSSATYAGQFKAFGGESFDPVAVELQGEDRAVVKRRLTTGSGRQIAFDYLMTRNESGWQIVTIITDGVSDLAIKRTQYQRILNAEDFDAVIAHIQDTVESQSNE